MSWNEVQNSLNQTLQSSNAVLNSLDKKLKFKEEKRRLDTLWPALLSSLVALITTITVLTYSFLSESRRQALEAQKSSVETTRLTIEIFKFTNDSDTQTAQVLLDPLLKRVAVESDFTMIKTAFDQLAERKVLSNDAKSKQAFAGYQPSALISGSSEIPDLISKLNGPDRLSASKRLVELYAQNKEGVVNSLINALLPPNDQRSYRVNLYVALTLGRIEPDWEGSEGQLKRVRELKDTPNYQDSTFQGRVDEAISNYKQRV